MKKIIKQGTFCAYNCYCYYLCLGFITNPYTEEQMNFTDADYTDSDYMLSQDKTTSESYSLLNFTDYIKKVSQDFKVKNELFFTISVQSMGIIGC